jgi:hypothetical protein
MDESWYDDKCTYIRIRRSLHAAAQKFFFLPLFLVLYKDITRVILHAVR